MVLQGDPAGPSVPVAEGADWADDPEGDDEQEYGDDHQEWRCGLCGRDDGDDGCWFGWPYTTATCPDRTGRF